jgi:alpha-D-xyloside xylohydrolase
MSMTTALPARISEWATILLLLLWSVNSPRSAAQIPGIDIPPQPPTTVTKTDDGMTATIGDETLHVAVCGESVIHVTASPKPLSEVVHDQPWMLDRRQACPGAPFQFNQTRDESTLTTRTLKVIFSPERGNLTYTSAHGEMLLREGDAVPRTYEPTEVNGEKTFKVTDRFLPDATEGFYGLGQHQNGMFNYRGATVELGQNNTDVAIPLLISSKGYALQWNTAALTYADNRFPLKFKFTSLAGDAVDYYLIYGPEIDQIIHEYRTMTGHTPMFAKWAYGFIQSKDRYISQQEVLDIAHRYRAQHIPMDVIVQDWFWWLHEGDPIFNPNFPDVPAELRTLHDEHVHAMLSVWGLFDPAAKNFATMVEHHFDVPDAHVYDATNPAARDFYWNNLAGKLFAQGWDAFWLDSAEPEEYWPHTGDAILFNKLLSIGNGARYTNIFPLVHTGGVQEHWRQTTDQKRVFLLTRSAFLGQQRNGATVWSGDVYSTYWGLQHQVTAGLNFALSGNPYWTTDSGGYWQPFDRPPTIPRIRSSMHAGSSSASFALSSVPTAIAFTMSCGPTTRSSQPCCSMTNYAIACCPISTRLRGGSPATMTPSNGPWLWIGVKTRTPGTSAMSSCLGLPFSSVR